jgi:ribosomal protein S18 acetylase RimI-like enzyme
MLAESGGRVVGLLQYQFGDARHHSRLDVLKLLVKVLGPIRFLRRLPAIWSRTTVDIDVPKNAFHITHLHMEEAARGQNVGTTLLNWGQVEAVKLGAEKMSLTTLPTNVNAIRFYERFGFTITKTASSPSYVKRTGIPGRLLLEKDLPGND